MILLRYIFTLLPAVSAVLFFVLLFLLPALFLPLIIGWLTVAVASNWVLGGREARKPSFWLFFTAEAALFLSTAGYLLILEDARIRIFLAVLVTLVITAYSWCLYLYLYLPARYAARSLEHLSLLADLLAVLFSAMTFFGLRLYLALPAWQVSLGITAIGTLLLAQTLWTAKIPLRRSGGYLAVYALVLLQLAVAMLQLPLTHMVSGAVIAVAFYLFASMTRGVLSGVYQPRHGRRFTAVAFVALASLFGTARWT